MEEFKEFMRTNIAEMRPYVKGEDLTEISVSKEDNPETDMGMIARNPQNYKDQWYVARKYFEENFKETERVTQIVEPSKTLDISDVKGARKNISDLSVFGNGDTFRLLCKASSQKEGWMKSTKVCNVAGGCIVQVTTQQKNPDGSYAVAEALCYVPGNSIYCDPDKIQDPKIVGNVYAKTVKED